MARRTREQWQTLIDQQLNSGLSAAEFCKQQELNENYFSTVKYKLRRQGQASAGFVRARITPESSGLKLHYGSTQLSIPANAEPNWLAQLLKALAS